jgi:hypothetical protein
MKKLSLTIFAAAALTLLLTAQVTNTIRADIPFEFVVGQTTAPAGTYIFSFQATEGMVRMQLAGTAGRFVMTSPDSAYTSPQESKLVFHRYGNQYFLSRIGTTSTSRGILTSPREREAKKTTVAAGRQMQTEIVLATR